MTNKQTNIKFQDKQTIENKRWSWTNKQTYTSHNRQFEEKSLPDKQINGQFQQNSPIDAL